MQSDVNPVTKVTSGRRCEAFVDKIDAKPARPAGCCDVGVGVGLTEEIQRCCTHFHGHMQSVSDQIPEE